jgi:DNA-binding NarL/FixJ family response regulator
MNVVLFAHDLMVVSRVQGAAARTEASVHVASSAVQAVQMCRDNRADLLIVDLAMPALELDFVQQFAADCSTKTVAFGPHVHEARLAAAREAGCDLVLSRGRFLNEVDALLQGRVG